MNPHGRLRPADFKSHFRSFAERCIESHCVNNCIIIIHLLTHILLRDVA